MELATITEIISTLGFPIALVIALGWFIWQIYKRSEKREDDLRAEIKENQVVNADAIKTLGLYAERLDNIQSDVGQIKTELVVLTEKMAN